MNKLSKFHLMILNKIDRNPRKAIIKIKQINHISESETRKILTVLLEYACKSENTALIKIAREYIKEIPLIWLRNHFIETATACVDFYDEWEYYRIVELIEYAIPEFLNWAIEIGFKSDNPEVVEAALDYSDTHNGLV